MTLNNGVLGTVLLAGCILGLAGGTQAKEPSQLWRADSENQHFVVEFGPQEGVAAIGRFQSWVVHLRDPQDDPVYPARIGLNGGMPGHGHGMPTQPQVTRYLGEGRYLVEGMKLNMAGDWVFVLGVQTPSTRDRVTFQVTVDY